MKKITELPLLVQLGLFLAAAVAIVAAGEYFYLGDLNTANSEKGKKLATLKQDNEAVRPYENKLKQIKVENEQLSRQLVNLRTVVPQDKDADAFIRMMQEAGVGTGVGIRRFTSKPLVAKEFYVEMPFEIDIDGSYSNVLQFFDKLGKLSRIVNVSNLTMGPVTSGVKGVRKRYAYTPNETVVASCTATTFFAREAAAAGPGPAKR